jgi:hypothetical protein
MLCAAVGIVAAIIIRQILAVAGINDYVIAPLLSWRMATTALMRANVYVITAISARSRRPTSQGTSASEPSGKVTFFTTLMLSSRRLACCSVVR